MVKVEGRREGENKEEAPDIFRSEARHFGKNNGRNDEKYHHER